MNNCIAMELPNTHKTAIVVVRTSLDKSAAALSF